MFEGIYTRWGIWPKGHDLAGQANIELLKKNYTKNELRDLITELMAIRDRLEPDTVVFKAPK